jgi:hypothetical protein
VFPFCDDNKISQNWKEGDFTWAIAIYRKGRADLTAIDNFGNIVFHHIADYQAEK